MSILLINPPVAKPCEPPAGIARLAGSLKKAGVVCRSLDLNIHGLLEVLKGPGTATDTWGKRALVHRHRHLRELKALDIYHHPARYHRAVRDLGKALNVLGRMQRCEISLSDFSDPRFSPQKSEDLKKAAASFKTSPFYSSFKRAITSEVKTFCPDFIGISISYLSQAVTAFGIIGFIRHQWPDIKIICGGGLLTSWMSSPQWNEPFHGLIDFCVKGPGESAVGQLFAADSQSGLGTMCYDDFSFTDYLAPGPIVPYAASTGCYWQKCTFCPDHAEKLDYVPQSRELFLQETAQLIERYKPLMLHFLDNAISPQCLSTLANNPLPVPWYGFARFETVLEDPSYCQALKAAGCIMLKLGLESGSQRVLDQLNKGITLDRVRRILANLHQAGIATYIYLLFGTPAETPEDAWQTYHFVRQQRGAIDYLNLAIFNMPACNEPGNGTGRKSTEDLSLYRDFTHPHGWDRRSVRRFLQTQFRRDREIGQIIKRVPFGFGSNHAPLRFLARQQSSLPKRSATAAGGSGV